MKIKIGSAGVSGRLSSLGKLCATIWMLSITLEKSIKLIILDVRIWFRDFPGGAVVKNPPVNSGDVGSIPGPGRSHMPQSN